MSCTCVPLTISDIMNATDEPFTLMVRLYDQGWIYDAGTQTFYWPAGCCQHGS